MLLLTPGPTPVPERVRAALARPVIHHRTDQFESIQRECNARLQKVFRTSGPVLSIVGSGTTAFEAASLSLTRPGDSVLACASGRFGERWQELFARLTRFNITCNHLDAPWGAPITPDALRAALRAHKNTAVISLVHCETSTTALSDLRALAAAARSAAPSALLIVDAIASLGAVPIETEQWGIDALVAASQKALMCPPGLGFVSLGPRAVERLNSIPRADSLAPMILDLREYLSGFAKGFQPCTPAVSQTVALREALEMILEEGVENVWARTRAMAHAARAALPMLGFTLSAPSAPSDSVTGAFYPDGLSGGAGEDLRRDCIDHGVQFADGQDRWKGKMIRFSHMGAISPDDTTRAIETLADALSRRGVVSAAQGAAAVEAARERLAERV